MKYKISKELITLYCKVINDLKETENTFLSFLEIFNELNRQVYLKLAEQLQSKAYGADDIADFYLQLWQESKIESDFINNQIHQNLLDMMLAFQDYTDVCDEKVRYASARIEQGLTYFLPETNDKLAKQEIVFTPNKNIQIAECYFKQLKQDEDDILAEQRKLKEDANQRNASLIFTRNIENRRKLNPILKEKKKFEKMNPGQVFTLNPKISADNRYKQTLLATSRSFMKEVNQDWQVQFEQPVNQKTTYKKSVKKVSFVPESISPEKEGVEKAIPMATFLSNNIIQLEFDSSFLSENTASYYRAVESNLLASETIDIITAGAGYTFDRIKKYNTKMFNERDEYEIGGLGTRNYRLDPTLSQPLSIASVKTFLKSKNDISEANCNLVLSLLLQSRIGIHFKITKWLNQFLEPMARDFLDSDTIIKLSSQLSISLTYNEIGSVTLNFELPVVCGAPDDVEKIGKSNFSVEVMPQGKINFSPVRIEIYDTAKSEFNRLQPMLKAGLSSS